MNSQEELAGCLRQLMEALAPNHARRLSIVRDGDKPRVACAQEDVRRGRIARRKQANPHVLRHLTDLEVCVLDYDGIVHALVFPYHKDGAEWVDASDKKHVDIQPTQWRKWTERN